MLEKRIKGEFKYAYNDGVTDGGGSEKSVRKCEKRGVKGSSDVLH